MGVSVQQMQRDFRNFQEFSVYKLEEVEELGKKAKIQHIVAEEEARLDEFCQQYPQDTPKNEILRPQISLPSMTYGKPVHGANTERSAPSLHKDKDSPDMEKMRRVVAMQEIIDKISHAFSRVRKI